MKLFKKDQSRYSFALIFSLVLHAFSFGYVYKSVNDTAENSSNKQPAQTLAAVKLDSVKFITREQLAAAKAANNMQIVANETNGKNERPVDSRFAGEKDQTFDRQTMAQANGAFKKAGLGTKEGAANSKSEVAETPASPKKVARSDKPKNDIKHLNFSDLGTIKISQIEEDEKNQAADLLEMNKKLAAEVKRAGAQGVARGSSSESGFARNNDFVEEIPLGDMTNLNTTEFKYYGFYHRIRQRLEQYWGSTIQSKAKNLYKSGRRLPASENLITAITVTLDDRGQILDIKIDGTSGIRELDQAAIESFNKAGPFPNPPKGLLVGGRAIIQWGFVVKS